MYLPNASIWALVRVKSPSSADKSKRRTPSSTRTGRWARKDGNRRSRRLCNSAAVKSASSLRTRSRPTKVCVCTSRMWRSGESLMGCPALGAADGTLQSILAQSGSCATLAFRLALSPDCIGPIPNGVFIAAMIHCGHPFIRDRQRVPMPTSRSPHGAWWRWTGAVWPSIPDVPAVIENLFLTSAARHPIILRERYIALGAVCRFLFCGCWQLAVGRWTEKRLAVGHWPEGS